MPTNQAKIVEAARAWALALAKLEETKQQVDPDSEMFKSAELAMYSVADCVEALKSAERALYRAVQLSGTMPR